MAKQGEDLRVLPKAWTWVKLSEIAELIRGVSYKKSDASKAPQVGKLPILRANNIDGELKFEDFVSVWNAFIISYELHVHPDPVSGVSGTIVTPLTPGEKDMSPAENDKVLMNG